VGYGATPSRLGFRGTEDLGGGLSAIFTLESGIMVDTGGMSQSRLFGRQAFVGLSGDFGSLTFGRQYTMRYYGMLDADIFAAASQGLGALDSGIPNARADNSISYRGKIDAFSGGVNYSFGRDTVSANNPTATNCPGESTDKQQCREWSVMGKYDGGTWGVVSAYERQNGGTSATYGGLTSSGMTDSRLTVNGYAKIGEGQLGLGWLKRNNDGSTTPRSNLYWVVMAQPVSAQVVVDGMVAMNKFENSPNKAVLLTLRGTYLLSKRTSLYLSLSSVSNSGTLASPVSTNPPGTAPLPGGSQQSVMAGIRHTF
jgi:predicted porin